MLLSAQDTTCDNLTHHLKTVRTDMTAARLDECVIRRSLCDRPHFLICSDFQFTSLIVVVDNGAHQPSLGLVGNP
jgi:hypothetical protein